jgi:hypothetical protein
VFPGPAPNPVGADALRAARLLTLRDRLDRALGSVAIWEFDAQTAAIGGGSVHGGPSVVVGAVGRGVGAKRGGVASADREPSGRASGYGRGAAPGAPPPPPPRPAPAAPPADDLAGLALFDGAPPEPAPAPVQYRDGQSYDFEDDVVEGELARPDGQYLSARASASAAAQLEADSAQFWGGRREVKVTMKGGVSLSLFDDDTQREAPLGDPGLPANLAGGLDYTFRAQTRATIPSSDKTLTVPLSADVFPVTTLYAASPGLRPVAYLKATVTNSRAVPILAGPVDIFVGADYVGTGKLQTTGAGGALDLPLGADEDLRMERRVVPNTVTEGVFGKEEITRYITEIDVANDKRRAVKIRIAEQFPIDGFNEDVKVTRGKTEPKPIEGPDDTGRMVFELEVPAGQTRTVRFEYRIRRPENWQLQQH